MGLTETGMKKIEAELTSITDRLSGGVYLLSLFDCDFLKAASRTDNPLSIEQILKNAQIATQEDYDTACDNPKSEQGMRLDREVVLQTTFGSWNSFFARAAKIYGIKKFYGMCDEESYSQTPDQTDPIAAIKVHINFHVQ